MNAPRVDWRIVEAACADLIGRPFRAGARGPDAFDCWGLVRELRARLGLPVPPDYATGDLTRGAAHALFRGEMPADWRRVDLRHGAIVLSDAAAHAGVLVAGRVIHAQFTAGVVAWSLGYWSMAYGALECWEAV
jgi:cell wall-associated NlpC family hydrolase